VTVGANPDQPGIPGEDEDDWAPAQRAMSPPPGPYLDDGHHDDPDAGHVAAGPSARAGSGGPPVPGGPRSEDRDSMIVQWWRRIRGSG
jgi:hypothetical protein